MKNRASFMTWAMGLPLVLTGCSTKVAHFGEPLRLSPQNTVAASHVFAEKAEYDGKFVRVKGTVDSVCVPKGCWLRLGDSAKRTGSDETLFVKFTCPIEGRLIPMEAVGQPAIVEGTLELVEISEEEARHYKEDAGAPPEEIAKIVGPQQTIRMKSAGAVVLGIEAQSAANQ